MNRLARLHVVLGLCFAIAGLLLGIVMAATHDHTQHVTHAHTMLLGFVLPALYATVLRQWVDEAQRRLARVQFALHHLGSAALVTGLFLLYGRSSAPESVEPVLAGASVVVLVAATLMLWMVARTPARA